MTPSSQSQSYLVVTPVELNYRPSKGVGTVQPTWRKHHGASTENGNMELLSSSDDESLGGEEPERQRRIGPPHDEAPLRERSIVGSTPSGSQEEPEEELMETLFFPRKPTGERKESPNEMFQRMCCRNSSSSALNTSSQRDEDQAGGHKPVISASAMLLKFLPKGNLLGTSSLKTPEKRPRAQVHATNAEEEDVWRKRAKKAAPEMSESERIARKYGLLSSREAAAIKAGAAKEAAPSADSVDALSDGETIEQATSREKEPTVRRRQSMSARELFWKSQTPDEEEEIDGANRTQVAYVSPFSKQRDGFRDMRRRRGSAVDKETFYTDDAKQEAPVNRPRHVIASKLTEGVEVSDDEKRQGDEDGWFSDAKEVDLDEKETEPRSRQTSSTTPRRPRLSTGGSSAEKKSYSRKRPRLQPVSNTVGGDVDEEEIGSERWPMLPPPKNEAAGPLKLESPTGEDTDVEVCANINSYLFDYQREGVQFLFNAYTKRTGAILGDEMGLGKTIQVIALLAAILGKTGDQRDNDAWREVRKARRRRSGEGDPAPLSSDTNRKPILIVVPASLLHNWESELKIWMCCCTVILMGKPEDREKIVDQAGKGDYEIVICSYDVLKITLEKLKRVPWEVIVFDEMHCLKNPDSKLTQAVKAIKCPRKLGLTGTLMQNNEKELHCLIDTIAPGVLGSWQEFRAYYGDDIKYGRKKSAAPEAVERSRKKEKKLRQMLIPYYLRREKEINPSFQEVKKCDQVVFCDLTPYQLAAYERILEMPEFELLRKGEEPCDCGRESGRKRKECCYHTPASLGTGQRALLWERFHSDGESCNACPNCMGLVCVAQLLKLSNHMELLKVNPRDPPELQKYQADFAAAAFGDDVDAVGGVQQVSTFQEMRAIGTQTCGKMLVLEKLLTVWKRRRQKTLLFSRSTRMLDILQLFLISKAVTYLRLDGNTKVDERLQLVNKFNDRESNISVFLISTRAGGLGLNLPTATNVVIFDPSWNPAHDCQAQDRAYRIGQTKDVQVYRLITLGTIEEMIYVRQIYKQQLSDTTLKGVKAPRYFEGVQGDRRQQGELFGIWNLLCWKEGGVLKDIQDAYKRDRDDIMIQENHVQYDIKTKASTSKKPRAKLNREMDLVDEEMVEVADEMTSNILAPSQHDGAKANDHSRQKSVPGNDARSGDEDGETQDVLHGAKTFMHEQIVGEEGDHEGGANPFSETDEEDEDEEVSMVQMQFTTTPPRRASPLPPSHPPAPLPAPPSSSPAQATPPSRPTPSPARNQSASLSSCKPLYIPKYL